MRGTKTKKPAPFRLLIVEDKTEWSELLAKMYRDALGSRIDIEVLADPDRIDECLNGSRFDLLSLDLNLEKRDVFGITILRKIGERKAAFGVIVITGVIGRTPDQTFEEFITNEGLRDRVYSHLSGLVEECGFPKGTYDVLYKDLGKSVAENKSRFARALTKDRILSLCAPQPPYLVRVRERPRVDSAPIVTICCQLRPDHCTTIKDPKDAQLIKSLAQLKEHARLHPDRGPITWLTGREILRIYDGHVAADGEARPDHTGRSRYDSGLIRRLAAVGIRKDHMLSWLDGRGAMLNPDVHVELPKHLRPSIEGEADPRRPELLDSDSISPKLGGSWWEEDLPLSDAEEEDQDDEQK